MIFPEKLRVLVLDDQKLDFIILNRHLETVRSPQYELIWASTAQEARAAISENDFDAAFVDYRLSEDNDGLEFVKELGGREAPFPIILLTGMSGDELGQKAIQNGAYDYIEKIALTRDVADRSVRFAITSYLAEKNLRKAYSEAAEQAAINRRLLSIVTHEMKSPVGSIFSYADHILEKNADKAIKNAASKIKAASTHLEDFLQNLSEFVRLDNDGAKVSSHEFHLKKMLSETVDLFEAHAHHKNLFIDLQADDNLNSFFVGDRLRIRQVIINLLRNAIFYSEQGSIVVSAKIQQQALVLTVQDEGVGMAPEKVAAILSAQSTRRESDGEFEAGLGIGLSICHRLLRLMGGKLTIESEPGSGTTAGFILPIKHAEESKVA